MAKLLRKIVSVFKFSPRQWYLQRIKLPLVHFIYETIELYKQRTQRGVHNVKDILFRGSVIAFVSSLLVWLSILMYFAFYLSYVPAVLHERPVYLQFNFPSAHVLLTKRQQLLMFGQPYKIKIELEMPESPANKDLGMFMVCAEFRGRDGKLITHSCRAAMLHYRSVLLQTLRTLIFSPFFLFGSAEEKQQVSVELFSEYEESESQPVTDVYIEVQSRFIELYSAKFLIRAHFSGLRYMMFQWPVVSAVVGITSNLFFIAVLCVASWYQLINSDEYINYQKSRVVQVAGPSADVDDISSTDSSLIEDISSIKDLRLRKPEEAATHSSFEGLY